MTGGRASEGKRRGAESFVIVVRVRGVSHLALIDAAAMPAYLVSTNPINNPLYERVGFNRS